MSEIALAEKLRTLEDVLHVGLARGWSLAEIVVQDELTHDVIVATPGGSYLVFDTT